MQFGIFSVGDVTPDPTAQRTPTEHERRAGGRGGAVMAVCGFGSEGTC